MKRLRMILSVMVVFSCMANAQFTLTLKGFVNSNDETKDYVVFEFDGLSKSELFQKAKVFVNKNYVSAKDVLNEVENENISVNGFSTEAIRLFDGKMGKLAPPFNLTYSFNISFKEGKIRINAPDFKVSSSQNDVFITLTEKSLFGTPVKHRIFNPSNGKTEKENSKSDLESFFNILFSNLKKSINGELDDNW
ncbi:hypothetical protein Barb6_01999 [Bacteroidales bacterium Barb6]|nr:hypothetical protein Barb6_01999 [Bacteroidales bacterium Barb6]